MSDSITFDTLVYAKKLKQAGVPEEQAEVHAEALAVIIDEKLATKRDLKELEISLKRDMKASEVSLKRDMKELEVSLKRDMIELELRLKHDLTLRLGAMLATGITIIALLVTLV